jgi:exopolysaccharide biosynthesis polyprenyl glycosylphosphotransferase
MGRLHGTVRPAGRAVAPTALSPAAARAVEPVARGYHGRDYWRRRLLAAGDVVAIVAAFAATVLLVPGPLGLSDLPAALLLLPVWLVLFTLYGLYSRELKRISHSTIDDVPWLFHGVLVGALLSWPFFALVADEPSVAEMGVFGGLVFLTVLCARTFVRRAAREWLRAERVLLVGDEAINPALIRKLGAHPEYGLDLVGVLAAGNADAGELRVLGHIGQLHEIAGRERIERIVVANSGMSTHDQVELLRECRELGLKISLLPQMFDAMGPSVVIDDVEGITVLGLNPPVLSRSSRATKRAMDLVGAAAMLIALAPAMIAIALAVRLTSAGPVFFRQRRIGRGGEPFRVIKFRTMYRDAEDRVEELRAHSKDPNWLHLEHDPRITPVGRFLRMTSLDELPQLFNVLRGQMSLVGPRPLIEEEDRLVDGWGRSRLALTPGLTGFWQVLGRTSIPFDEMVKLDYLYVVNWSVWNDVRLILRTLPAVIAQRGAN